MPPAAEREKLWGLLGILVFLLLNFPLLIIFNRDTLVGGVPLLVCYLFGVWILAIAALFIMRNLPFQDQSDHKESKDAQ